MLKDQYDNPLSTTASAARDGYVAGLDLMLAGQAGVCEAFVTATAADENFALGWVGLARAHHYVGDMVACLAAIAKAKAHAEDTSDREKSHIAAFDLMFSGQTAQAYSAIRAHVAAYPRDAMVAQTCSSVFGLIGFSGQPGREAEMLAYTAALLPHYGEDWWAISQYAFALCETGNLAEAERQIDKALNLRSDNAHGAHVRSHVYYETGETVLGRSYLADWLQGYDPAGVMFTHLNWHEALWALEQGDLDTMWERLDAAVSPAAGSGGPAINILTDTVSLLHRAGLAGVGVSPARWKGISDFAKQAFPKTGNAFIDIHAALAHAMAGDDTALKRIIQAPSGPAADLVPDLATGFGAMARGEWPEAAAALTRAMSDTARIGGSRAQRDMVEQTLLTALMQQGKRAEARDIAALRRPHLNSMVA